MSHYRLSRRVQLLATACGLMVATPAFSQTADSPEEEPAADSSQDIVVTATRRDDRIIDIPQSIQAVSGATLERLGAASLQDVINQLPGVTGFSTGTGKSDFSIRGVASFGGGVIDSSTVGFYLDEVPLSNASITPDVSLYDLERIEVLRGPQGTLYGEGSLGGTIRLVTRRPDLDDFEGELFSELSTTRSGGTSYRGSAVLNVPIATDHVALRVVGTYSSDGGFIDDAVGGQQDVNSAEFYNVRAALRIKPADMADIQLGYTRQKGIGGPEPLEAADLDLALRQAFPQTFRDSFDLFSATVNLDLGAMDLVYAASYFDRRRNELADDLGTGFLLEDALGIPVDNGVLEDTTSPESTWTHEVRLLSTGDGAFNWLVGGYYKDRDVGLFSTTDSPDIGLIAPAATEVFRTEVSTSFRELAAFGEISFRVTDALKITGGTRVFRQDYDGISRTRLLTAIDPDTGQPVALDTGPVPIRQRTRDVLYKASIDYRVSSDLLIYALFAQGVRGGGVNTRLFSSDIPRTFDPDAVDSYEIGFKLRALNGRLGLNASVYQLDWRNIQVGVSPAVGIEFITNAGQARSRGVEAELTFRPTDGVTIGGGYALTNARLRSDVETAAATIDTPALITPSGSRLANVAKHKFNIFADLRLPVTDAISAFARADGEYVGSIAANLPLFAEGISVGPVVRLPGYFNGNLRIGLETDALTITAFVENITNRRALLSAINPEVEGFLVSRPRTFGVGLTARF
ncbi:MAG: TonB-dependent receptor [Sphingopyxis sp.]|nr:TonB-dependent receptor [Sphingopyxis sp.]